MDPRTNLLVSGRHYGQRREFQGRETKGSKSAWTQYRISIRCAQVEPSPAAELLAKRYGRSASMARMAARSYRLHETRSLQFGRFDFFEVKQPPKVLEKRAEAYLQLDLRRLKAEDKRGMTEWRHANRWRDSVRMRKRCYAPDQVAKFEQIHRAVQALHSNRGFE